MPCSSMASLVAASDLFFREPSVRKEESWFGIWRGAYLFPLDVFGMAAEGVTRVISNIVAHHLLIKADNGGKKKRMFGSELWLIDGVYLFITETRMNSPCVITS